MKERSLDQARGLAKYKGVSINLAGLINLFVVYVVWGTTYLAIRIAVRQGSEFPAFAMGAVRMFTAGGLLLLWASFIRSRLRPKKQELLALALSGLLLWMGGTGLVIWAEQRAESGYAALLIGALPIWASGWL